MSAALGSVSWSGDSPSPGLPAPRFGGVRLRPSTSPAPRVYSSRVRQRRDSHHSASAHRSITDRSHSRPRLDDVGGGIRLVASPTLHLVDGLANPTETRPAPADNPPPPTVAWPHRFKPGGQPAEYELFDHVWLSPALATKQIGAFIDRRTRRTGDGSDHDPAWVVLDL